MAAQKRQRKQKQKQVQQEEEQVQKEPKTTEQEEEQSQQQQQITEQYVQNVIYHQQQAAAAAAALGHPAIGQIPGLMGQVAHSSSSSTNSGPPPHQMTNAFMMATALNSAHGGRIPIRPTSMPFNGINVRPPAFLAPKSTFGHPPILPVVSTNTIISMSKTTKKSQKANTKAIPTAQAPIKYKLLPDSNLLPLPPNAPFDMASAMSVIRNTKNTNKSKKQKPNPQKQGADDTERTAERVDNQNGNKNNQVPTTSTNRATTTTNTNAAVVPVPPSSSSSISLETILEEDKDTKLRKKETHRQIEKKRRDNIAHAIQELSYCLPREYKNASKFEIITSAAEYIKALEENIEELKANVAN